MKKSTWVVLGFVAAACSTREEPSDLQYDPTVRIAYAEAKKTAPACAIFTVAPRFLDDSQASPDNPRYRPPSIEGTWNVSSCSVVGSGQPQPSSCTRQLRLTLEGGGHIFTDDGIAFLLGSGTVTSAAGEFPSAMILQRVQVENGGCVEGHIRQFWLYVVPEHVGATDCILNWANCGSISIFDVVVGSTCGPVGAWTCTSGLMTRDP